MAEEALVGKIARYSFVIIGFLIVALVLISGLLLQNYKWIDVFTNSTDIFLFVIALPLLTFAFGLIIRGTIRPSVTQPLQLPKPHEKPQGVQLVIPFGELKVGSTSATIAVSDKPPIPEVQIPPQFEIAQCLNCGSKWPVPPLSPLEENISKIATMLDAKDEKVGKDLPRTVTCPKCGVPAPVTAQPKTTRPVQATLTEFDVAWRLSGDVQTAPFGTEDRQGSDIASKLHFVQRGDTIELTAIMNRLKPSHLYHVTVGYPYTVKRPILTDIIGDSRVNFTTDENGSCRWFFSMNVGEFRDRGIASFSLCVNDAPCRNATVLLSDNIPIRN